MIDLQQAEIQRQYVFAGIKGSSQQERHLANLGFVKGAKVQILARNKRDSFILLVQNTRLAITKELSEQILLEEADLDVEVQTLDKVVVGSGGVVTAILGQGAVKRRLMDMGLTRGVEVQVQNIAPLGDPLEISIRGYQLSLRKEEAQYVCIAQKN